MSANATKLYGMGLRQAVRRSVLSDVNKLYVNAPLGLDVNSAGKVYALDSSTIDLCLSLFG